MRLWLCSSFLNPILFYSCLMSNVKQNCSTENRHLRFHLDFLQLNHLFKRLSKRSSFATTNFSTKDCFWDSPGSSERGKSHKQARFCQRFPPYGFQGWPWIELTYSGSNFLSSDNGAMARYLTSPLGVPITCSSVCSIMPSHIPKPLLSSHDPGALQKKHTRYGSTAGKR